MEKETIYYKINYKTNIFLKDKGNIRVYEITSENKRINGIEIYQLETNKKYFLLNSLYKTNYYETIKELLKDTKLTHPKYKNRISDRHHSEKILKHYKSLINFFTKYNYKKLFILITIVSFIFGGIELSEMFKNTTVFNREIQPQTPDNIFEKYKSSVVLIASQYYYEVYANGKTYYYSPGTETKLFFSKEEVLNNLSSSTGTGFIISENGEIITNNHVVNHKDENYKIELANFYEVEKSKIAYKINICNDTIEQVKSTYNQYHDQMNDNQKKYYKDRYNSVNNEKILLIDFYKRIENVDLSNSTSKLIIHKLGIAYNDSHVTEFDDLQECVVVKTSEDEKIDLALIQTKNKSFNTNPNFIFNFNDNNPNIIENPEKNKERNIKNPVKINEDVFMIGFNRGFSLAKTKQGIKSQFTSGKISQENDGERILYTIPPLEGSSGSPIVDKWGNLVGVNFAKITNSQSFSFGVPVNEVKKFYEE